MLTHCYTVKELIAELQDHDPEMEVRVAYLASDYWRTVRAEEFRVEIQTVKPHRYFHDEGWAVCDQDDEGAEEVLCLLAD